MGLVYKITNSVTKQIYVGKTEQTLEQRFSQHVAKAKLNKSYLHRSMTKYGIENFGIELLEEVDNAILNEREIFWIDNLNSFTPNGLNLTRGGDGGDTSKSLNYQEARKRLNFSGKNNPNYGKRGKDSPNYGKTRSNEQKEALKVGVQHSWDTKPERKMAASNRFKGSNNPGFGKKPRNSQAILLEGVMYLSIADASKASGLSPHFVKKKGLRQ